MSGRGRVLCFADDVYIVPAPALELLASSPYPVSGLFSQEGEGVTLRKPASNRTSMSRTNANNIQGIVVKSTSTGPFVPMPGKSRPSKYSRTCMPSARSAEKNSRQANIKTSSESAVKDLDGKTKTRCNYHRSRKIQQGCKQWPACAANACCGVDTQPPQSCAALPNLPAWADKIGFAPLPRICRALPDNRQLHSIVSPDTCKNVPDRRSL